jgi:hypothetical protein
MALHSTIYPIPEDGSPKTEVMFEGLVLADREYNMYDDSDFYVLYWDWEIMRPRQYTYDTTRFGGGGGIVDIDATPEVLAAYRQYQLHEAYEELCEQYYKEARQDHKGDLMKVFKGRKNKEYIGRIGKIFWMGEYSFSYYDKGTKYGIRFSDEKNEKGYFVDSIFEYDYNLENLSWPERIPSDEDIWNEMIKSCHPTRLEGFDHTLETYLKMRKLESAPIDRGDF